MKCEDCKCGGMDVTDTPEVDVRNMKKRWY